MSGMNGYEIYRRAHHASLRDSLHPLPPAPEDAGFFGFLPGIDSQEDKNTQWAARSHHNIVQHRNLHDLPHRHQGRTMATTARGVGQDVDHRDGNSVKQGVDASLPVERGEHGERLVDQDTGFFVVSPVIGE